MYTHTLGEVTWVSTRPTMLESLLYDEELPDLDGAEISITGERIELLPPEGMRVRFQDCAVSRVKLSGIDVIDGGGNIFEACTIDQHIRDFVPHSTSVFLRCNLHYSWTDLVCCGCGAYSRYGHSDCGLCGECCNHSECRRCGAHNVANCDCEDDMRSFTERTVAIGSKGRAVGLEVEFNEGAESCALQTWEDEGHGLHEDGSCGWELVTRPTRTDALPGVVRKLSACLDEARINSDCGVHVHVDARDVGWYEIRRLLALWGHIESLMYVIGGQERYSNTYCKPIAPHCLGILGECGRDLRHAVFDVAMGEEIDLDRYVASKKRKKGGDRYRSLNLMPWIAGRGGGGSRRGDCTIEFRLHRHHEHAWRTLGWAELVRDLVTWCASATDGECKRLLAMRPTRALVAACPSSHGFIVRRLRGWKAATSLYSNSCIRRRFRGFSSKGGQPCAV